MTENHKRELLLALISTLCDERGVELGMGEDAGTDGLFSAFRALVNTRPPIPASEAWLALQDELLRGMIADASVTCVEDIPPVAADPRLRLWRGDITTLAADAVVNAANSRSGVSCSATTS